MKHPFYRFDIKNKKGKFTLLIGCTWDAGKRFYEPIEKSAFALLCPCACQKFETSEKAQGALKKLKKAIDFRKNLC